MTRNEALVGLAATSLLFLAIFGSWRRQSKNFLIQKGVLLIYTLSSSLISYILGSMQSSPVQNSVYPIWALSLYVLLSSVDTTACSLTDNNQLWRVLYRSVLDFMFALVMISSISSDVGFFLVLSMYFMFVLRFGNRIVAAKMATESWNLNKIVSDYMEKEHKHDPADYDPCKMDGYRYLVDWPVQDIKLEGRSRVSYGALLTKHGTQVIDIEKVWKLSNDRSLGPELRDACLSFSLFHLLRRRFFGFPCGESSQPKTHDFVFKGLLKDHKRAFEVIEVELAFMYDFFFTKYAILYYGSWAAVFWSLVTASLLSVTAYLTATSGTRVYTSQDVDVSFLSNTSTLMIDSLITMLILACIALLQVLQQLLFWMSIWGRVSFVCQYVRQQASNDTRRCSWSWCMDFLGMKFKEILAKIGVHVNHMLNQHYWQDKLDQYSLLESIRYNPVQVVCDHPLAARAQTFNRKSDAALSRFLSHLDLAAFYPIGHRRGWIGRKPGKPIKLPAQVKKALVESLHRTQGVLTNGELALVSNGAYHLLWALRLHEEESVSGMNNNSLERENQATIILTWHIATCYCEMAASRYLCPGAETELKAHLDVATKLSKYCAYLVVSAPKLLPGHHFDTKLVFDEAAAEASDFLGHAQDKYECMRSSQEARDTSFHSGVKLGKQLEVMEDCARWKVLAEFWAEMLLYLAPSDNVNEHFECLSKGGEFITHLWALLTHAGILDRGQRNNVVNDIENPGEAGSSNRYSCLSRTTIRAAPSTFDTNQPPTTGNPTVQVTHRDVGDRRDSRTDQQDPRELPYGAALRLRHASSYLDKCADGAASAAARATNKPAFPGNGAQTIGMMVHQPANPVQNGEGARNDASNGLSEIEDIA